MLTVRGWAMASVRADLVISWKVMRLVSLGSLRTSKRCQEMDSPSRSSSVASQTVSADLVAFLSSETTLAWSGSIS